MIKKKLNNPELIDSKGKGIFKKSIGGGKENLGKQKGQVPARSKPGLKNNAEE